MKNSLFIILLLWGLSAFAQPNVTQPEIYIIEHITIDGLEQQSEKSIKRQLNIQEGDRIAIPGSEPGLTIKKLIKNGGIEHVSIDTSIRGRLISFHFTVDEKPRLNFIQLHGVKKKTELSILEQANINKGMFFSAKNLKLLEHHTKLILQEKGYHNHSFQVRIRDTIQQNLRLEININKGDKHVVKRLHYIGVTPKLKRALKRASLFMQTGKIPFIRTTNRFYHDDKLAYELEQFENLLHNKGYLDAQCHVTSKELVKNKVEFSIQVDTGKQYYFGHINFIGNQLMDKETLREQMEFGTGDLYNPQQLHNFINGTQENTLTSLYASQGRINTRIKSERVSLHGDTIDINIYVSEGKQYHIRKVMISGNKETYDYIIQRELNVYSGDLFTFEKLQEAQWALYTVPFIDVTKSRVIPHINTDDNTVDLEIKLVEKSADMIKATATGGGAAIGGIIGGLEMSLYNFSLKNAVKPKQWKPLPRGEGQRLKINLNTTGTNYRAFSLQFMEPWLGGKRKNNFNLRFQRSHFYTNADSTTRTLKSTSFSAGLTSKLFSNDKNWSLYHGIGYTRYFLDNYDTTICNTCATNKLAFNNTLSYSKLTGSRFYPHQGENFSFISYLTLPYQLLGIQGKKVDGIDNLIEYHKWYIDGYKYIPLSKERKGKHPVTLALEGHLGFVGGYKTIEPGPFERFILGGDAITGNSLLFASDFIGLRGYGDRSITQGDYGGAIFEKFSAEMRFPVAMKSFAPTYLMGFFEAGNTWNYNNYQPLSLYKSIGVGFRSQIKGMIEMIGVDWGWRLDPIQGCTNCNTPQVHFTLGYKIR